MEHQEKQTLLQRIGEQLKADKAFLEYRIDGTHPPTSDAPHTHETWPIGNSTGRGWEDEHIRVFVDNENNIRFRLKGLKPPGFSAYGSSAYTDSIHQHDHHLVTNFELLLMQSIATACELQGVPTLDELDVKPGASGTDTYVDLDYRISADKILSVIENRKTAQPEVKEVDTTKLGVDNSIQVGESHGPIRK